MTPTTSVKKRNHADLPHASVLTHFLVVLPFDLDVFVLQWAKGGRVLLWHSPHGPQSLTLKLFDAVSQVCSSNNARVLLFLKSACCGVRMLQQRERIPHMEEDASFSRVWNIVWNRKNVCDIFVLFWSVVPVVCREVYSTLDVCVGAQVGLKEGEVARPR